MPCPELARVVTAWGKIPPVLKEAILAILASVEGAAAKGGRE